MTSEMPRRSLLEKPMGEDSPPVKRGLLTLSRPSEDPNREALRAIVTRVEEVNPDNYEALSEFARIYLRLLKNRANRHHFTGIPKYPKELEAELKKRGVHGLAIFNGFDEIVGFATIADPDVDQNDSWLNKFVIVNNLQNKKQHGKPRHAGRQSLDKVTEWAFTTPTHDGRPRESLHAAVVMKVPNSQRMDDLLTHFGFTFRMRQENQASVFLGGKRVLKPVERFALERRIWEIEHSKKELHRH